MERGLFDAMTKAVASAGGSRRKLVAALLIGVLSGAVGSPIQPEVLAGKGCRKGEKSCHGKCCPKRGPVCCQKGCCKKGFRCCKVFGLDACCKK